MNKISYLIIALLSLSACELRTPSKIRFERACDIRLPKKYEVVRDEYQDMLQDFKLYFTIKFDSISQRKLTNSIRRSKYFDSEIYIKPHDLPIDIIDPKLKAIWVKSYDGYRFINQGLQFSAVVDTIQHLAEFNESSD